MRGNVTMKKTMKQFEKIFELQLCRAEAMKKQNEFIDYKAITDDILTDEAGLSVKLAAALDTCMYDEKKLTITGRSNGATCAEFADYVMSKHDRQEGVV